MKFALLGELNGDEQQKDFLSGFIKIKPRPTSILYKSSKRRIACP